MPYYEYQCDCDAHIAWFDMGQAPRSIKPKCGCTAPRVYGFNHVEDRRHMRKGLSPATGMPYAESRGEERRIEKEKGIEFIGTGEMPKHWGELKEVAKEVKKTGEKVDPFKIYSDPSTQTSSKGSILKKMAERGLTFGS